jgi:uncharacterized protein
VAAEDVAAVGAEPARDRVGIGWRPELAAGILSHLDRIEVVEVVADDLFGAPRRQLRAMQTLAAQVPVVLHGVSLGLASAAPADVRRLDHMARVTEALQPEFWSEHLAFVRGEGLEIGHLAAPPRTEATIAGTVRNVARARQVLGAAPLLENVATLIDPPGSDLDEADWVTGTVAAAGCGLLLDLNNLFANASNFGNDARATLGKMPLELVGAVHLAGGKWIAASSGTRRLLDDHRHDVPQAVYDLLTEVAALTRHPLTVVLERDGAYPPFAQLLQQLDRAREALAAGRLRAIEQLVARVPLPATTAGQPQAARAFEAFLARLYVEAETRARFLADPRGEAERAGLDGAACQALQRIDRAGLELAAHSFALKRRAAGV